MQGAIRVYQSVPVVLFSKTFIAAAASEGTKFPAFTTYPQQLYVQGYAGRWGTYQFNMAKIENTGPAVFFDGNRNAFIISPASCFMDAQMTYAASSITSGLQSYTANFPAGYTYTTALVIQHGINAAFDTWGNALTALNGKRRPSNDADVSLEKCGYWTDNKATYYYKYESSRGYEGTLLAVKQAFDAANISLGYFSSTAGGIPKDRNSRGKRVPDRRILPTAAGSIGRIPSCSPTGWQILNSGSEFRSLLTADGFPTPLRIFQPTRIPIPLPTASLPTWCSGTRPSPGISNSQAWPCTSRTGSIISRSLPMRSISAKSS